MNLSHLHRLTTTTCKYLTTVPKYGYLFPANHSGHQAVTSSLSSARTRSQENYQLYQCKTEQLRPLEMECTDMNDDRVFRFPSTRIGGMKVDIWTSKHQFKCMKLWRGNLASKSRIDTF